MLAATPCYNALPCTPSRTPSRIPSLIIWRTYRHVAPGLGNDGCQDGDSADDDDGVAAGGFAAWPAGAIRADELAIKSQKKYVAPKRPVTRPRNRPPDVPEGYTDGATDAIVELYGAADPADEAGLGLDVLTQGETYVNIDSVWSAAVDPTTSDT